VTRLGRFGQRSDKIGAMQRREFLYSTALATAASALPIAKRVEAAAVLKPKRLAPGDTVVLVAPANATFNTMDLAGDDRARADDINKAFADRSVAAVHAIRGGWGSARLLPYLDFDAIRRNPKVLIGYSDVTALLLSAYAKAGLVTFHGPIGMGRWDSYSLDYYKRVLFNGEQVTYSNKHDLSDRNALVQVDYRTQTITPGTARGRLVGGNLTVMTAILGSPYVPDWDNTILFTEDTHEDYYRIDRMLTQLKLAGVLGRIKGFVFGGCAECGPGDGNFGALTLEEIFADHIKPLRVPAWSGAMIGHGQPQWTLPLGIEAEIDASAGTIRLLEPAVS